MIFAKILTFFIFNNYFHIIYICNNFRVDSSKRFILLYHKLRCTYFSTPLNGFPYLLYECKDTINYIVHEFKYIILLFKIIITIVECVEFVLYTSLINLNSIEHSATVNRPKIFVGI